MASERSALTKAVAAFAKPRTKSSIWQMINTILPFLVLWYLAYQSLAISYWLTLGICVVAAGFFVRIFILFHDCCHYAFFKQRRVNAIVGTVTGIITFFPYRGWQRDHSVHHATSSNLDQRGTGDIWVLTVDEYIQSSFIKRFGYRLYRNPIIMFGLGPIVSFLIMNRINKKGTKWRVRSSTYLTNAAMVVVVTILCLTIGWKAFLLVHGPIFYIAGVIGIWLFYVQHQFEDTYFEKEDKWSYVKAAVEGSSYYKLPKILQWVTGNIGFHHIHHLSPRVPNYFLEKAHNHIPALQHVTTITLRTSLQSLRFRLWDQSQNRFVGFRDIKHLLKPRTNSPL
ncbi:fatty acid desaturase [Aureibacillus halotolerans]|uniref:Omega-6 fatty acid desaturase (Delta-12 desaturase) n=1 Tax=Aureibacillus halotolerans TaxID=1508390 RepID=A0A4R6U8G4_9BACI|nr:fatty acid desaturase [Aureibacillus halotolerans]TDQ40905.1 omega-6 fatty acid desaturase (delta-12 desaturase) [Aureibacillus halotolerans]